MRSRERGGVFVIALVVLAGLVVLLASTAATQHTAMKAQSNRMEARRARLAAQSGIERVLAEFAEEQATTTTTTGTTLLTDTWATLGTNGDENFIVGSNSFRVQVLDASSFVNLNTAAQAQLERLPLTGEQVDCLLDWREAGQQPRSDGAKDEYYNQLDNPYNTKLGPLDSVDELLQIKSFTPATLLQPQESQSGATLVQGRQDNQPLLIDLVTVSSGSRPLSPGGQPRLNANVVTVANMVQRGIPQNVATQIFARRGSFTRVGQILAIPGVTAQAARQVLNNLTTTNVTRAEGKINLNTATEPILNTIPNLTPDIAAAIVARQSSGFTGLGDLMDIPGLTNGPLLQQVADLFEVNSTTFVVRVLGKAGQTTYPLQATIEVTNGSAKVTKIENPLTSDVLTRWNWQTDTTSDTTLKGNS